MKAFDGVKILVALVLLSATTNVFAKAPKPIKSFDQKYVNQFVYSMDHGVPAIVESSLYVVLQLKDKFPDENYNKLIDKFDNLVNDGPTLSIRYKAQLAKFFFTNYNFFKGIDTFNKTNPEEVFKQIANKIETNAVAVN